MIGWHKDKVVKGNVHSLHGEQSLSRRSPWVSCPPCIYITCGCILQALDVLDGRGVSGGLNVN